MMNSKNLASALAFAVVAIALVLSLAGCGKGAASAQTPPPPVVTVAPVEQREVTEWDVFTGRAEAVESVEVRPRVSGHIDEVRFQSGQLVKKGDVLFVIDPRYYKAELDRRQAEYEQAQVRLANAGRDAKRSGRLLASKAISSEEGDSIESQFQEAKAGLLAAQAILESARLDYEFTQVRAPIDGRVSRALLTVGNYVSGVAGSASLLTTIVSVDPIYVYADVDENSLLKFNALARERAAGGNKVPVELALGDDEGFPERGVIESFDNRVDANTGTIVVRAEFANPGGRIVPGLFARIRIPMSGRHDALLVDEAAIGTDQAQKFVLTLGKDNTVQYRAVKLGPAIDGKRIVRSGLEPGEKIIVNGLMHARPGMPVTPQEAVAATEPAGPKTAKR
ncbi:MAG TPA: efflux RND transporter periplasmic adaptor subunit [Chthoniobacterales bacterium]